MGLKVGDKLPEATLLRMGADGPESVSLSELTSGRKIVLFGLPGAYTGTCSTLHVPSFMRTADALRERGISDIVCVAVNDPFVVSAWADSTGAQGAGLIMLADADSSFTKAAGMNFTAPPVGFYDRSKRYSAVIDDGVVAVIHEDEPGVCNATSGEAILDAI